MAGRIRTIKPELLEDEVTASLSDGAFRLFIGSLLLADDYGNLRASPLYLAGAVGSCCGWDAKRTAAALAELVGVKLLQPYTVRGQTYAHIKGWDKHQRVDKPGKPRCPNQSESTNSGTIPESVASDSGLTPTSDLRPPTSESDPERERQPALLLVPSVQNPESPTQVALRLWEHFNRSRMTAIPGARRLAASPDSLDRIAALLESYTSADVEAVIDHLAAQCKIDKTQWQHFDGVTPFRPANFLRALGKVGTVPAAVPPRAYNGRG